MVSYQGNHYETKENPKANKTSQHFFSSALQANSCWDGS